MSRGATRCSRSLPRTAPRRLRAFTLTELMVATSIFLIVVGGVLASHLFGMRMLAPTAARQKASDESRKLLNLMANEIRSARTVKLGTGTASGFTENPTNFKQVGNAVQLWPTTNTNFFIRYFRDSTRTLRRTTNNSATPTSVATGIASYYPFSYEDFSGNLLFTPQVNAIIAVTLQYAEVGSDGQQVGTGRYFNYYSWKTRIQRRALE